MAALAHGGLMAEIARPDRARVLHSVILQAPCNQQEIQTKMENVGVLHGACSSKTVKKKDEGRAEFAFLSGLGTNI